MEKHSNVSAGQRAERKQELTRPGHDPKRRGEVVELGFMHKAASLGFEVAKPYGDSCRYNFILDSGERLWRAQVKST